MEFTTLGELITYQTDLVSRNLTKFVKDDSLKNKKELRIKEQIERNKKLPNQIWERLIPSRENLNEEKKRKQVLLVGIITFAGIIIHNIPEGMAAFMSTAYDLNSGIIIVIAISLHNIPEGLAVAGAIVNTKLWIFFTQYNYLRIL